MDIECAQACVCRPAGNQAAHDIRPQAGGKG